MQEPGSAELPFALSHITVSNYRGLEVEAAALERLTVLYGINGSGKTSLLCAAAVLLEDIARRVGPRATPARVRLEQEDFRDVRRPIRLAGRLVESGRDIQLSLERTLDHGKVAALRSNGMHAAELARRLWDAVDTAVDLPVLGLYPVNRAADHVPLRIRGEGEQGRRAAYEGAFTGERQFRAFFAWFRATEDHENERRLTDPGYRDPQLEAVRTAVARLMPGYERPRVQRKPRLRMVVTKQGLELAIQQLSEGERVLLSLAGDIAMRAAVLNPHLPDPLQSPGCVLIDELDLHLHPQWQAEAILALPALFPRMQFVVATHSPIVVSHATDARVYEVADGGLAVSLAYGKQMAVVLQDLFGKAERPPEVADALTDLGVSLQQERWDDAAARLAGLAGWLGSLDPDLVRARRILQVRAPR